MHRHTTQLYNSCPLRHYLSLSLSYETCRLDGTYTTKPQSCLLCSHCNVTIRRLPSLTHALSKRRKELLGQALGVILLAVGAKGTHTS